MIPDLDRAPYSEGLRRMVYDAVARIVHTADPEPALVVRPDTGELLIFYVWGRWFAVWRDPSDDDDTLPLSRIWQVARVCSAPSAPDGIMLHEV